MALQVCQFADIEQPFEDVILSLPSVKKSHYLPANFPTLYGAIISDFKLLLSNYEDSKEYMMVATEQCIKALNDIYQRFMAMMLDGQEIFRNDEVVRKQFVFTDVLSRVSGPS